MWQETQTLLDGHNRLAICERHGLDYGLQELSLPDVDSAKLWIIRNQRGRRNLTPEQAAYLRGTEYNLQKSQGKRTDLTSHQSDGRSQTTAQALAAEHHVGTATIERDAAYAAALDQVATAVGPGVSEAIRSREMKLSQADVKLLATLLTQSPETVQAVKDALTGPDPASTLKAILSTARCGICHRPLSDPASVSRGIGPICAGHGNGAHASPPILSEVQDPEPPEAAPSWPQQVYTGDPEWYTPDAVLALVRAVLGPIDVDPASCAVAQATVQAHTFYTIEDDGLRQPWPGTVFCNPPYKLPDVARFIGKLCEELDAQRTTAAILLVNNATETDWFQRAFARANAVCFPDGKIHFVSATHDGHAGPCVGQALLYYGPDPLGFCTVFATLGVSTRVVCADAAQLALAATPPAPDEVPAPLIPERNYCIVHVSLSNKGSVDFESCSLKYCFQTAHFYFWTHDPRPTGLVWVNRHRLCRAHAEEWCTAHQVDIGTIPTISSPAWIRAQAACNYDQVPWFRFATAAPALDLAETPGIPAYDARKFVLGKLCANKHEWGQTGQTLRRIEWEGLPAL